MEVNRYALRAIRLQNRQSVSSLARSAGIEQPHLSNIEAGRRRPSPSVIASLADALAIPVEALVLGHISISDEFDRPA